MDLYARDNSTGGTWRWVSSSGNNAHLSTQVKEYGNSNISFVMYASNLSSVALGTRNFIAYLPARALMSSVEIGTIAGTQPPQMVATRPSGVVWYGTSIIEGAAVQVG